MYRGRILAIGDSALAPTGYGNQADTILPRLAELGWDVYQFGCNHWFDEKLVQEDGFIHHKGIKIIPNRDLTMPNGAGLYGTRESVVEWYNALNPDIVFSTNDFYRVAGFTDLDDEFKNKWIHWLPIDNPHMVDMGIELENKVRWMVYYSSFAWKSKAPYLTEVPFQDACYLAVDNKTYHPLPDKESIKKKHGATGFVITTVARHQPRKMVYLTARAVAKFMAEHPDTFYICKCNPDDESMRDEPIDERDLQGIFTHMGVPKERVLFASNPMDTTEMNELYNMGDVFIHISGGEGFGLPYVESMLAEVPVILADNTTSPELTNDWEFGFPVAIKDVRHVKMFNCKFDYPDVDDAVVQLEQAYNDWKNNGSQLLKEMGRKARIHHTHWCDADRITSYWDQLFLRVIRYNYPVVWNSFFGIGVGFSELSEAIIPELCNLGYPVLINDYNGERSPILSPFIKEQIAKTKLANLNLEEYPNIVCWLMESFDSVKAQVKMGWSLCESTKLRPFYQAKCNKMDHILTSSEFNKKVQEESGITAPIRVIPPCVDPEKYHYVQRLREYTVSLNGQDQDHIGTAIDRVDPYTFLHIGVVQERKNTEMALEGYCRAFPDDGRTKFILKTNHFGVLDYIPQKYKDRKDIELVYTNEKPLTHKEMLDLYIRADCYVNISHGEGIGMPDLEAMATGLPVIGLNWDTRGEFITDETGYPIEDIVMDRAYTTVDEDCGEWAYPSLDAYITRLKEAVADPKEARRKGLEAARLVQSRYSPRKTAEALDELLLEVRAKMIGRTVEEEYGERYYTEVHKYTPDWHEGVAQYLIAHCDGLKGHVVDIGCGRGYVMKHLLAHGVKVVGLERSPWPVQHPIEGCEGKIFLGDALDIDASDQSIDWGISFSVLEHIPEPCIVQALKEIARTCKRAFLQIAIPMFPGHEDQLRREDASHITLHPYEWWTAKFAQVGLEVLFHDGMNIIVAPQVFATAPTRPDERVLVGIPTKDRLEHLAKLLRSLNEQDYQNFDVIIVDDSKVANLPGDQEVMAAINGLYAKGHGCYACRGVGQNQAVAHNNILTYALGRKYNLVLRVDDDITLRPDFISRLAKAFHEDANAEVAAIGGVFLNPMMPDEVQFAPSDWGSRPEFAGTINPCVLNAQIVQYKDTVERETEHLYSSYMYRPELLAKVGGFPTDLSPMGFREETLPLYELHLQGWTLKFLTGAIGYHFNSPTGGLRSIDEAARMRMFEEDNAKFERRVRELRTKYGR